MTDATDAGATETLREPTLRAASDLVADGIARGALVTVYGRCTVDYEGRAASSLDSGDRHVMCKPDGATLVHTHEGQQPVNWQPPGCAFEVSYERTDGGEGLTGGEEGSDGGEATAGEAGSDEDVAEGEVVGGDENADDEDAVLVVESRRTTPEERLCVRFRRVHQVSAFSGTDESDLSISGTEADLRERILETPAVLEPGFVPLATERPTPAGAVDVYGEDAAGRTVVVELKRRRVGPDAVSQLRRYVDAVTRDLHADATVRGILVAPSVTDRADGLLAEHGLEFVSLDPVAE